MYYGEDKFSPLRIVAQIGLCQLGFYAGFVGLLCALAVMLGVPPDPRSAFEWRGFHLDTLAGCVQVLALGLNALLFSFVLLAVVGRARKCLDFAATAYLFHVAVVCVVAGVPKSVVWWVFLVLGTVVSTVVGEVACLKRELKEIPVGAP